MTDLLPWSGPGLWTGAELVHDSTFITTLSDQHVVEIEAAVEQTKARGLAIEDISRTDFPLPGFGMVLQDLLDELLNGRGFALIRGLPVERLSRDSVVRAYWGIGTWLGDAGSQNAGGHLLGHVTEQMTPSVLRARIAQPGPDTPIGAHHAVARQPLDGQAADQGETATVQQFVQQILQNHAESG